MVYSNSQYDQIPLSQRFIRNYVRHAARIWYDFNFDSSSLWSDVNVNMSIFEYIWGTLFKEINIAENLEILDKPVFLALGRYDFVVAPPESWNLLCPKFQNLSMHIFEYSGHSPFYEEPDLFDAKLLDWLSW